MFNFEKKVTFAGIMFATVLSLALPMNVKAAQPTKEEQKIIKDAKSRIEAQPQDEDPNWAHEIVVGWQFSPDKNLLKKLENVKEYVYDDDFSLYYDKNNTKLSEKEFNESLYIIDTKGFHFEDEVFTVYGTHDGSRMYVKTTDDQYVEILVPPVSNHEEFPDLTMADYDGDDEYELSIIPHVLHGTGYYEDTAIIIDKSENGTWFAYHLPVDFYRDYFNEHIEASCKNKKLSMKLNGEDVGTPVKVDDNDYDYYFNSLTEIQSIGSSIYVSTVPLAYSKKVGYGIGDLSDYKIWLTVEYHGNGEFAISDSMYQLYARKLYEKEIDKVPSDKFYSFIEGPCVESPLMAISTYVNESWVFENPVYKGTAGSCEVYVMKNNKLTKIGEIEGDGEDYLYYDESNIIVYAAHSITTYSVENNKIVLDQGIQDDVICAYDKKYEGYGIFDGKKFKKISKKMYEQYRKEAATSHEMYFVRGSAQKSNK